MVNISDLTSYTGKTRKVKKTCQKHGDYIGMQTQFGNKWRGGKCPQCSESEKTGYEPTPISGPAHNVPKRFAGCSFDNYIIQHGENQAKVLNHMRRYAENFKTVLERGCGLILHGKCGTGKTHLAYALANHVAANYLGAVHVTKVFDMINEVKQTWGNDSPYTETQIISKFTKPDLLIIDEMGVQFDSEAERLVLFRIMNKRYEDMKPTVLVTNLNREKLQKCITERVMDRMLDGGGFRLVFDWASFRK